MIVPVHEHQRLSWLSDQEVEGLIQQCCFGDACSIPGAARGHSGSSRIPQQYRPVIGGQLQRSPITAQLQYRQFVERRGVQGHGIGSFLQGGKHVRRTQILKQRHPTHGVVRMHMGHMHSALFQQ
jgi:hypothetical protein